MKKSLVLSAGLCAVLMFASCGSKDSAYRKAYDKAKAAEAEAALAGNTETTETPVVTPLTPTQPQQQTVRDLDRLQVVSVVIIEGNNLYMRTKTGYFLRDRLLKTHHDTKRQDHHNHADDDTRQGNTYRRTRMTFRTFLREIQSICYFNLRFWHNFCCYFFI